MFINRKDENGLEYWFGISNGDGFGTAMANETGGREDIYSDRSITDTDWHFFTITYDGSNIRIYIDGVLDSTTSYSDNLLKSTSSVYVGHTVQWDFVFNGYIDDIGLWNRSLSSEEVEKLYSTNLYKYGGSQWYLTINQTKSPTAGLDNGDYTYNVSAVDSSGDTYQTRNRQVMIDS